jgi:Protein of unknown function (DUF2793)
MVSSPEPAKRKENIMSIVLGPKLGLLYNSNINEYYADNFRTFLQAMDALIFASVVNATTVVPPASPAPGNAYLLTVGTNPSGAWTGQAGKIAVWNTQVTISGTNTQSPAWVFYTPQPGWILWNVALGGLYVYNGSAWTPINAGVVQPVASYGDQIGSGTVSATANVVKTWAFNLEYQVTFGNIAYSVQSADASGSDFYSLGIYNNSGVLLASTGAVAGSSFSPTTGFQVKTLIGSTVFPAGNYFLGLTGTSATAALYAAPSQFLATSAYNSGSSSGGALPSSISIPATSWSIDTTRPSIALF